MTVYAPSPAHGGLQRVKKPEGPAYFTIMTSAEFQECPSYAPYRKEVLRSLRSARYCKVERFHGCIAGTLRIPQRSEQSAALFSFGFCVTEDSLVWIEDTGKLERWVEKHASSLAGSSTPEQLLLELLERLTEDDILYLSHLEKKMEELEAAASHESPSRFFLALTQYRRKLSELNAYYAQLTAIGEKMQSYVGDPMGHSAEAWEKYAGRTERLQSHVNLLRETLLQLRELFQSLQDARQNKIMALLTVVTSLFLPLTLLTGWYGMNFVHMPELQWRYGYYAVAAAAAIIVAVEIIWFRRKRFF